MLGLMCYLLGNQIYGSVGEMEGDESTKVHVALTEAGFPEEDIVDTLAMLAKLDELRMTLPKTPEERADASEKFMASIEPQLKPEVSHYLDYIEKIGLITGEQRHVVTGLMFALDGVSVSVSRLKMLVLAVLWSDRKKIGPFLLDEIVSPYTSCTETVH